MKTRNIWSILLVGLLVVSGACSREEKKTEEQKETLPVVRTAEVSERAVEQIGIYTASVEPEIINNISAQTPNRIREILVDEGMRVSAGQRLVVMDDVNTISYETQVNNAKANLDNVKLNYDRAVELLKIGGGTRQQVDQMETQLINAKNTLAAAERALRNVKENTVLTSPISGVVTARNYDPGDMTGNLPILTVARINPVKVVTNVSESEFSHVKVGMPVTVTFDTYGDEEFQGTVSMISPTVDTSSRTFGVEVRVANGEGRILPGMFGRVTMKLGESMNVVVPDQAVVKQQGSGSHFVYVLNSDSTVSYHQVELGRRMGNEYELLSGVEPGSVVVTTGQRRLADGRKVTVQKSK